MYKSELCIHEVASRLSTHHSLQGVSFGHPILQTPSIVNHQRPIELSRYGTKEETEATGEPTPHTNESSHQSRNAGRRRDHRTATCLARSLA